MENKIVDAHRSNKSKVALLNIPAVHFPLGLKRGSRVHLIVALKESRGVNTFSIISLKFFLQVLKVKIVKEGGQLPVQMSGQAAGYDLISPQSYTIKPGQRVRIPLGIAIQVPEGTYGRLCSRSSVAWEYGVGVEAGVIDADYRDEISILLVHKGSKPYHIFANHRIGQLILERYVQAVVTEVAELTPTVRGLGGWGSTGR